jgi:hypothetical protein
MQQCSVCPGAVTFILEEQFHIHAVAFICKGQFGNHKGSSYPYMKGTILVRP